MQEVKNPEDRVKTGARPALNVALAGKVIELLPDDGALRIAQSEKGWEIECQIENRRILKKDTDLEEQLAYLIHLFEELKSRENEKGESKCLKNTENLIHAGK